MSASTSKQTSTDNDLDCTNIRSVWIVKVPKYVANSWKKAPPKTELGRLQISKTVKTDVKFITDKKLIQEAKKDNEELPEQHSVHFAPPAHQTMAVFSHTKTQSSTEKVAIEGEVTQEGRFRPLGDKSYMSLKSNTIKEAAKPTRITLVLDKAPVNYRPRAAIHLEHEAEMRKKNEGKKLREDKEVVQQRLFQAFEQKQFYNIKELESKTKQSIPYLKEVLREICNYRKQNPNKNMYELKQEYRHYKTKPEDKTT